MNVSTSTEERENNIWISAGGGLGVAGCIIGLAAFLGGCAGFSASFDLGFLPVAFSVGGFFSTVVGSWPTRSRHFSDTRVVPALFVNLCSLLGGILLLTIALHWRIFNAG